ncbi:hypothetical protein [Aurantiacibacter suaedae]|uniref:hypothetical protein n=1 Tax=Aurantiacibacter suaedae TaxID=2545755 RepID=UPI0013875921|nr:hypothetical protein [Aurantiacibacter suaedae]
MLLNSARLFKPEHLSIDTDWGRHGPRSFHGRNVCADEPCFVRAPKKAKPNSIVLKPAMIVAGALFVTGCVMDRDATELSDSAAKGRAFAHANCASCHALKDGVLPNPNAPSLEV